MELGRAGFDARLERLEARLAIRDLVARYVFAIDDRDLVVVAGLFTAEGRFRSADGAMNAVGRAAIVDQFKGRYGVLGPTNHVCHDHVIDFDGSDRARGLVSAHAELWRHGRATVTAMRYADVYQRDVDGEWRFADRALSFLYYVPVEDYATALGRPDRNRAGPEPRPADYPEKLAHWPQGRSP
jgi:ketosteroid isomerase-like protein